MATQTQQQPTSSPTVPGGKAGNYLVEVRKEMRKVNWPARNELLSNTVLTLVASLVLALLIFFADQAISWVLAQIYG
ncbi:MAG TPA: preprotein translocase subunit SecE [Rubricoccaceae bacterium]|nr:preprotein translocase subunit SecE [Rubricoccaceae bacterium]